MVGYAYFLQYIFHALYIVFQCPGLSLLRNTVCASYLTVKVSV